MTFPCRLITGPAVQEWRKSRANTRSLTMNTPLSLVLWYHSMVDGLNRSSAWPFHCGWYRGVWMWSIVLGLQYSSNSDEQNCVSLSDTRVSGKPWVAKMRSKALIVAVLFIDGIEITSYHLGFESSDTKQTKPMKEPTKITYSTP